MKIDFYDFTIFNQSELNIGFRFHDSNSIAILLIYPLTILFIFIMMKQYELKDVRYWWAFVRIYLYIIIMIDDCSVQ